MKYMHQLQKGASSVYSYRHIVRRIAQYGLSASSPTNPACRAVFIGNALAQVQIGPIP